MSGPKYLVFEGPDGSGKSTLAKAMADALERNDHRVRTLAFPGQASAVGRLIRDVFVGKETVSDEAMLWLFVAEAKDIEPQITHHLAQRQWVVADRHTLVSSRVYQTALHGQNKVESVIWPAELRIPDRVYLLDLPPEAALARCHDREEATNELYETDDLVTLAQRRREYRKLFDQFLGARILDATRSTADLLREIWRDLSLPGTP